MHTSPGRLAMKPALLGPCLTSRVGPGRATSLHAPAGLARASADRARCAPGAAGRAAALPAARLLPASHKGLATLLVCARGRCSCRKQCCQPALHTHQASSPTPQVHCPEPGQECAAAGSPQLCTASRGTWPTSPALAVAVHRWGSGGSGWPDPKPGHAACAEQQGCHLPALQPARWNQSLQLELAQAAQVSRSCRPVRTLSRAEPSRAELRAAVEGA